MNELKHWHSETDTDHIMWLGLDAQGRSANALNAEILRELDTVLDSVAADPSLIGLIIYSRKSSGFIAGADIESFKDLQEPQDAKEFILQGQAVFNKLEALRIPTVAMIEGFCLGGGMELALACDYRVAEDSRKTKLGLPEVMLGIHPGWGGTLRLPRLIGAMKALQLIVLGKSMPAKAFKKLGAVDAAVPERQLRRAAIHYIKHKPKKQQLGFLMSLTNAGFVRPLLAWLFRREVKKKVRQEHYPAPYAIIDNWLACGVNASKTLAREADSICKLLVHDTAKNLVRIFFLQEQLKSLGKNADFKATHVHVVGAGVMGGDIAAWCAYRGMRVTLQDREAKYIAPALQRANKFFKKRIRNPLLRAQAMDRLIPDVQGGGIKCADVIIEAIYENLEAKQSLFKLVEEQAKPNAILATNTSSIPLDEINTCLMQPERLVGVHFFNPVPLMQLVEVVKGEKTSDNEVSKATAFVRQLDKLPLPVKSHPGFLVNRVLMPYLMECVTLLEEGVAPELIDEAALRFGMPMGPVELADTVGLDICLSVGEELSAHFGGEVPQRLRHMVEQGNLGKKSGKGFYAYKKGKPVLDKSRAQGNNSKIREVQDRLVKQMLDESQACLNEGIVASADLLDTGMIFGTGFAPFRGGPMHYLKNLNEQHSTSNLEIHDQVAHDSRNSRDVKEAI